MKRTVTLALAALLILGTTAFGQGIRVETKKVEKKKAAAPAREVIEQEIEIELEDLAVPGCPSCEAKKKAGKGGCGGCKGDGSCGKKAGVTKTAIAISGNWNKLPPETRKQMLEELRARYDDDTLRQILKALAGGRSASSIGIDGKALVGRPGEKVIILQGDPRIRMMGRIVMEDDDEEGEEDLEDVIENLKGLRERIRHAKSAGDLEKVAEELSKARVRVESSRGLIVDEDGRRHLFVTPKVQGVPGTVIERVVAGPAGCPHCSPRPITKCGCQGHDRRPAPKCGCQGHGPRPAPKCCGCNCGPHPAPNCGPHGFHPIPQPPRHAGYDDGLRHSLDALRGEIAGLRAELRAMRGQHAAAVGKAATGKAGTFKMSGVAPGAYRVAVKHPPAPPPPVAPSKGTVVKHGKSAAGGFVFGAVPAKKPDPRQARLEQEVADLKKEMGHMKAMMHEMLKKLDEMKRSNEK